MSNGSTEHLLVSEAERLPNNDALPLILYKAAVSFGDKEPESVFEEVFRSNQWGNGFRDGTFPFHHYHSAAHEVVGVARGSATLQFGGPTGPVVDVHAGDAVVIPAGVCHRRVDDAPGYSAVGAYPPGQAPDCCVMSKRDERIARHHPDVGDLEVKVIGAKQLQATKAAIAATVLPETDPLRGNDGLIRQLWHGR